MPKVDEFLRELGIKTSQDQSLCFERMCNRPVATKGNYIGGLWIALSTACHVANFIGRPFLLSTYQPIRTLGSRNIRKTLEKLLSILKHDGRIVLIDEPTVFVMPLKITLEITRQLGYVPTKQLWTKPTNPKIAYCFDGNSAKGRKCPTKDQTEELLRDFLQVTTDVVQLGLPNTFEDDVYSMCTASVVCTTSTGISHIAHSTGAPMVLSYFNVGQSSATKRKALYDLVHQYHIGWYGSSCKLCKSVAEISAACAEFIKMSKTP